jgi:cytochrome bd-type quinol oxidase subunit 2
MKIFPTKDNIQRTEQELRLQPFTLLTTVPVVFVAVAGFTYTCVYSDTQEEVFRHAIFSLALVAPFVLLFAAIWKREAKRSFSVSARTLAWRFMLFAYVVSISGLVFLYCTSQRPEIARFHLITCILISLPIGYVLIGLNRKAKQPAQPGGLCSPGAKRSGENNHR